MPVSRFQKLKPMPSILLYKLITAAHINNAKFWNYAEDVDGHFFHNAGS